MNVLLLLCYLIFVQAKYISVAVLSFLITAYLLQQSSIKIFICKHQCLKLNWGFHKGGNLRGKPYFLTMACTLLCYFKNIL
jgi:hypothetical protein